jgi:hypothetical protein
MKSAFAKFLGPRVRALGTLLVFAAVLFGSFVAFARLVANLPESILPFPDQTIQLSGMPATFQTAVLPKWEVGQKIPLPSGNEDSISKTRGSFPEAVYYEGTSSRLTVVIPGLGGNSTDSMNVWFARPFINGGDSVLILPSPSHPDFFELHLTSFDFQLANQALCKVVNSFVSGKHFQRQKISSVLLAGYSLGGRNVLEMPDCLSELLTSQKLSLEVFSMNPPIDLEYAASVLDGALGDPAGIQSGDFAKAFLSGLYTKLMALSFGGFSGMEDVDEQTIILTARRWAYFLENKDSTLKKLIATLFAYKLKPTLQFVVNGENGVGVDKDAFSFRMLTSALPNSRPRNLEQILDRVKHVNEKTKGRLFVLHSSDDFLIRATDLESLSKYAPEHVRALPQGGHVGAIFKPEYVTGFNLGRSLGVFPSVNDPRNEH